MPPLRGQGVGGRVPFPRRRRARRLVALGGVLVLLGLYLHPPSRKQATAGARGAGAGAGASGTSTLTVEGGGGVDSGGGGGGSGGGGGGSGGSLDAPPTLTVSPGDESEGGGIEEAAWDAPIHFVYLALWPVLDAPLPDAFARNLDMWRAANGAERVKLWDRQQVLHLIQSRHSPHVLAAYQAASAGAYTLAHFSAQPEPFLPQNTP